MAFKLVWSEEALEDIESIATYIEKDSPVYVKAIVHGKRLLENHNEP